MVQPRKSQKTKATQLPQEFIAKVEELYNDQFEIERGNSSFKVLGSIFPDELVVCICLNEENKVQAGSIYLSIDLPKNIAEKPEKVTEYLKHSVDLAASWFTQCFEEYDGPALEAVTSAISELDKQWQSLEWENTEFFVRVDRTNHILENMADEMLESIAMPDDDFDDDDGGTSSNTSGNNTVH